MQVYQCLNLFVHLFLLNLGVGNDLIVERHLQSHSNILFMYRSLYSAVGPAYGRIQPKREAFLS